MDQVKGSLQTITGNWILVLPIYLARMIPAFLSIYIFSEISGDLMNILSVEEIGETQYVLENYGQVTRDFFDANRRYIFASVLVGIFGLLMNLFAVPATAGMIKEHLTAKSPDISRILPSAGKYFLKYLLYRISKLALWIFVFLFSLLIIAAAVFLGSMVDEGIALLILLLAGLIFFIGGLSLHLILKLWFPAMVLGEVGVLDGLKEAFAKSRICFWPLFAGFIGIRFIAWIANMLVNMLVGDVTYLGLIVTNIIPSIALVTLLVFYFRLYLQSVKEVVNYDESG